MYVMLLDRDPDRASVIGNLLMCHGQEIDFALFGESALRRARDEPFDAILIACNIADISGLNVCNMLRHEGVHAHIVLMVEDRALDLVLAGFQAGVDDVLRAPSTPAKLRRNFSAFAVAATLSASAKRSDLMILSSISTR
ncbi:response regulator transcription factor [Lysobacter soli]|uniref:response regulator transcription factor n=1 Tax=Lysobacter soli TaxID=453783 RepID=UPI0037CAF529